MNRHRLPGAIQHIRVQQSFPIPALAAGIEIKIPTAQLIVILQRKIKQTDRKRPGRLERLVIQIHRDDIDFNHGIARHILIGAIATGEPAELKIAHGEQLIETYLCGKNGNRRAMRLQTEDRGVVRIVLILKLLNLGLLILKLFAKVDVDFVGACCRR